MNDYVERYNADVAVELAAREAYENMVDAVKEKYEERIVALLNRIKAELERVGYFVEGPDYYADEMHVWALWVRGTEKAPVEPDKQENTVDIRMEIAESKAFDGTLDGINFSIVISTGWGRILGQFTPYNYTSDVWVPLDDSDAVEERFHMFERVDVLEAVESGFE